MTRLAKPKPEHMATQVAIQSIKDTIKDLQLRIFELQATLPTVKPVRMRPKDYFFINPLTQKKVYYMENKL